MILTRINRELFTYGWPVVLVFAVGLLLTAYLTQRVEEAEARLATSRFAQVAQHRIQLVEQRFHSQMRELEQLRRYIHLDTQLTRQRFYDFSHSPEGIERAAGWVENLPRSAVDTYLARMELEYGPAFRLTPFTPSDEEDRLRLYPVTYLSTLLESDRVGEDIRQAPGRQRAMDRALITGATVVLPQPATTAGNREAAIMLLAPVFHPATGEAVTERHFGTLRGFAYLQLRLASLVGSVTRPDSLAPTATSERQVIDLSVTDISERESPGLLYATDEHSLPSEIQFSQELELADRTLRLTATPAQPEAWRAGPTALVVFAIGSVGATLVAGYLALLLFQRRRAERLVRQRTEALEEANAYRNGLLASAQDVAVIATDTDGIITLFSAGAEKMLGFRAEEMEGRTPMTRLHPADDLEQWHQRLSQQLGRTIDERQLYPAAIEAGLYNSQHWEYQHRNGERRQVQLTFSTICNGTGEVLGYLSVGVDLSDYVRTRKALEHSDHLLRDLSAEVPGVIFQFLMRPDNSSCFPFISQGVERAFELTVDQVQNSVELLFERIHQDDRAACFQSLRKSRQQLTPWVHEFRVQLPEHGIRWLLGESRPHQPDDGCTVWNGHISDITNLKQLELQLREQATVDPLTKAFNRRHLHTQWQQAIARYRRTGIPLSLIMLDIDHFKVINDTHGHDAGDEVLVRLSWLLNHEVRNTDMVYRLGGEEFLVVCEDTDLQGARTLAQSLQRKLKASPMPFVGRITASFSVTEVNATEAMDTAFKRLDNLLYRAKRSGRDRIVCSEISHRSSHPG
ncbi:sensor domain-containing diguanylate cyclase [Marinobacter xestospongiae]|uniref:sensor domain-containing diguanylate cyclase n=1 Tax=Marinobacter xestospongiae TaxID=994319 RepID=UPI002002D2E8|nr:diguanylate cyclase [Marinobacter xestospongiae]